jgi:ribose transport system permease protein
MTDFPLSHRQEAIKRLLSRGGLVLAAVLAGGILVRLVSFLGEAIIRAGKDTAGATVMAGCVALLVGIMLALVAAVVILDRREFAVAETLGPPLALVVVVLLFATIDWVQHWVYRESHPVSFWTEQNLRTVGVQTLPVAIASLGMTIIIIAGGIDLSVGATVALCATVLAWCLNSGFSIYFAIPACILTGCVAGLVNGGLVSSLRMVPFIVTLGTMTIFLGAAKIVANEVTIDPPIRSIPNWVPQMVTTLPKPLWLVPNFVPNFGWGVWLALLLAVLVAFILHRTVFGRHVFAVGSNEATARLCGIHVPLTTLAVYTLAGFFVGIAGVCLFAKLRSGSPVSGLGLELRVIAAVVVGGGSLNGGRASVVGTLCGAAIMGVIETAGSAIGLTNPRQDILVGAIIVAAAALDKLRQGRSE